PKKKVSAEFDKLDGKTTAIIVWADQATLDEDFAARYRVADTLRYNISKSIKGAKLVDIREITDYQETTGSDWEGKTNAELGKHFKADYVMRVDLLEYTTRARDAREVRKGRIRATISMFDMNKPNPDKAVYGTEISASWPPDTRTNILAASDADILSG